MYDTRLPRRPTDYFEGLRALSAAGFLADNLPAEGGEAREAWARAETFRDFSPGCSRPAPRPTACWEQS